MKLIFTCGDPNGIGIEIMLSALKEMSGQIQNIPEIKIAAHPEVLKNYVTLAGIDADVSDSRISYSGLNFDILPTEDSCEINFGQTRADSGAVAAESIETALKETLAGHYDGIVTMPVSKEALYKAGWKFPGHTEMLANACGVDSHQMVLMNRKFRVAIATVHEPLRKVPDLITTDRIIKMTSILNHSLKIDFAIDKPKIAILGLNPHSGEGGAIGSEEIDSIIPAIGKIKSNGIVAEGPHPADGFFARKEYENYDGILAMYHDQGLIPIKMLSDGNGVNFTAGLPIVRTSPDHGTAFPIAGKNQADHRSALLSILFAMEIADNRARVNLPD